MMGSPKAADDHVGNSTRSSDCLPMAGREYVDTHILYIYISYYIYKL